MANLSSHYVDGPIYDVLNNARFEHGHKQLKDINDYADWWRWIEEVFVPFVLDDTNEDIWDSTATFVRRKHGKPYEDGPVYNESYYDGQSEHAGNSVRVIRRNTLVAKRVLFEQVRTEETPCPGLPEEIAPNFNFLCYSIDHAGGSSDPYGTDDLYRHEKRRLQYDQEPTVVGYVFSIFSKFWLISGNL